MGETPRDTGSGKASRRWPGAGLSGRVLVLSIAFVMVAEVAIYIPSIANFRNNWLRDRLSAAYTAALVLEAAAPDKAIPEQLKSELLTSVGAMSIAVKTQDARRLLAASDTPPRVAERFDLRDASPLDAIAGAFRTLWGPPEGALLVIGAGPHGAQFIEITLSQEPLRQAMWRYSGNILLLSLLISMIVASLAVLALHLLVLRPVGRLTTSLIAFRDSPEDPTRIIEPSGKRHEIGLAEAALAQTQRALLEELREKKRLASLGLAVAKINHDLRNMLSSAQLLSDRLAGSPDPVGRAVAPKLIRTLDRAIAFCQSTLTYGRAAEPTPVVRPCRLRNVAAEAVDAAGGPAVRLVNDVPGDFLVLADREHLFRALMNLLRNACEALEAAGPQPGREPLVRVSAVRRPGVVVIDVSDSGPGVPQRARENLFVAFQGSDRAGGTGLGLAIAAELVAAHGGGIRLLPEGLEGGATFRIELPDRPPARHRDTAAAG